jgi:hypothetical protein
MAYARFGRRSDVYVSEDSLRFLCCMPCDLSDTRETRTNSRGEMIEHLEAHRRAGHQVPNAAIEELKAKIAKSGGLVTK